ncbi:MAG: hypothetical protein LLG04_02195 [Parachlamydia sp.]|nr:hypothetical protein [Parachlamydia sp.]
MEPNFPPSWPLPPGALPNPNPASATDTSNKRRGSGDDRMGKANSYENRQEQVQVVAVNIFMANAGSKVVLIAGRCGKWLPREECQALTSSMPVRLLQILGTYPQEVPKTEVLRFYNDFLASPLMRVRDRLAQVGQAQFVQDCTMLINSVNRMDDGDLQDKINTFLDQAEQVVQL